MSKTFFRDKYNELLRRMRERTVSDELLKVYNIIPAGIDMPKSINGCT